MMRRICLVGSALLLTTVLIAQEASKGIQIRVEQLLGQSAPVGRQYVALIAVDRYRHWTALRNPVKDAREIKEILSRRYFIDEFFELYDEEATKAGIIKLFDRLINITRPTDSLFIFYAGHGHLDKLSDTGFWIPADGGLDRYEQLNWLPNNQLRGFISKMKARHILLISDSCFSGDILNPVRSISPEINDEYFRNAYSRVSRQVLTSGASESVPDQSPFALGLKLVLEGNNSPYLDPLLLYSEVRLGVKGSTPLFGDLKDSGHQEGASYILFLKEFQKPNTLPKTTFKLEKTYGTLKVETQITAQLYLDGAFQGEVPVGSMASIENVETGEHLLEVWYEDGNYENRVVMVERDGETLVSFSRPVVEPEEVKSIEKAAPPAFEEPLSNNDPIPVAAIKIDGKFEDWKTVRPLLIDEVSDRSSMDLERVYIARDDKNIYTRIDIADTKPTTWLRPHNFDMSRTTCINVTISDRSGRGFWISLHVAYATWLNPRQWLCRIFKGNGKIEVIMDTLWSLRLRGSSLEASFPLSAVRKYILEGHTYWVDCVIGYNKETGKWIPVDYSNAKPFLF